MFELVAGEDSTLVQGVLSHVNSIEQYAARRVLPIIPTKTSAYRYLRIKPGSLLQAPDSRRTPGAAFARGNIVAEYLEGVCTLKGLEGKVPNETQRELQENMDALAFTASVKLHEMLRGEERAAAAMLFNRTTWPLGTLTGHDADDPWDDLTNAKPDVDVAQALNAIGSKYGDWNSAGLTVGALMSDDTARHAKLAARLRTGQGGAYTRSDFAAADIPNDLLATLLGVDEVVTPKVMRAAGGSPDSPSIEDVWSRDYCLVYVRTNIAAPMLGGLGVTVVWEGGGGEFEVDTYEEDQTNSQIARVRRSSDMKIMNVEAAYLIGGLSST